MDRLIYKEADGDLTCRSRDFDKVFPTLYAYEESGLTPEKVCNMRDAMDALADLGRHLSDKLMQVMEERDAAMADVARCCATCALCSQNNGTGEMCPWSDDCNQVDGDHWEWRGAKDTNVPTKKED